MIGTDGKPVGTGPYFGVGFDAQTPGAERLTPFRLHDGRWAAGPGEVVIDRATAESQDYAVGDTDPRHRPRRGRSAFTVTGIASSPSVKSLGKASAAVFDLEAARTLFAKDGYDRILVAGRAPTSLGAAVRAPRSARAADDDRFAFDSLETLVDILRTILLAFAGVAVLVGVVHDLQLALDHRRAAHEGVRAAADGRREPPPGARRRCCSRR